MKIFSALKIGEYHENNCEDHLYFGPYGKNMIICAVMDGCTTALESHFASTLVGKILKKICFERNYKEFLEIDLAHGTIEDSLKSILNDLVIELKTIKNLLLLDTKELLTTLIIMLIDKNTNEGIILAIGDGFANINGRIIEFEQENKPDYLGYHLSEDFEVFYSSQTQKVKFEETIDITIATDGIFTFEQLKIKNSNEEIDPVEFLTIESTNCDKQEMLDLKLKSLENNFGFLPTDDFSMIRIIK